MGSTLKTDKMCHRLGRCIEALSHFHGVGSSVNAQRQTESEGLNLNEMLKRLEDIVVDIASKHVHRSKIRKSRKKLVHKKNEKMSQMTNRKKEDKPKVDGDRSQRENGKAFGDVIATDERAQIRRQQQELLKLNRRVKIGRCTQGIHSDLE